MTVFILNAANKPQAVALGSSEMLAATNVYMTEEAAKVAQRERCQHTTRLGNKATGVVACADCGLPMSKPTYQGDKVDLDLLESHRKARKRMTDQAVRHVDEIVTLRAKLADLGSLLQNVDALLNQVMPNVKHCFGIDLALLNETLISVRDALDDADHAGHQRLPVAWGNPSTMVDMKDWPPEVRFPTSCVLDRGSGYTVPLYLHADPADVEKLHGLLRECLEDGDLFNELAGRIDIAIGNKPAPEGKPNE